MGAFGDDANVRDALLPFAVARATRRRQPPRRVIVIGDTPADVSAARAGAAATGLPVSAVAVGTGFATWQSLEESRPDLLLPDLAQGMDALLALIAAS